MWFKAKINDKYIDCIIDTGASSHNVIPKTKADDLGLQSIFRGRTVTTIGNEKVSISQPLTLSFEINGYEQQHDFVVIEADFDFLIFGMPFASTLTSVNFDNKTIYSGRARFPFTKRRQDINHLQKRQQAALIIYALNKDSYITNVPVYDINNSKKTDFTPMTQREKEIQTMQEQLADRLSHVANKNNADAIYTEIMNNIDAISLNKQDIGTFKGPFTAKIELTDPTPVFQPLRPQPYGYRDLLIEHEQAMIEMGVVEEGISNWRFNQVLAKKKTFGQTDLTPAQCMRPCTDFRLLNKVTKADPLPIPNAQSIIDGLTGKKYFSQYDLTSAYWSILIDDDSKQYTAFVSQMGKTLVYNRLPFGLRNAPSIFSRCLAYTLDPLRHLGVFNFLDDVIIATETIEQHITATRLFLRRMNELGWKIKIAKSSILKDSVLFLGFIISSDGIKADPERVKVYSEWERPTNARQLIAFVQSIQYYKRFIPQFSLLAAPLYDLTKKDSDFVWNEKHEEAFNELKNRIVAHTHLQFPKTHEPYRLTTDWQPVAVSYVLEQKDNNEIYQPIAFGGRKLSKTDSNLSSYDGEILAGYHAFVALERYLRCASLTGVPNTWRTDNSALTYAHSRKEIYGRLARIIMFLDSFLYVVEHVPSKHNPADPISRKKERKELTEEEWKEVKDIEDNDNHPLLFTTEGEEGEGEKERETVGVFETAAWDEYVAFFFKEAEEEEEREKAAIFVTMETLESMVDDKEDSEDEEGRNDDDNDDIVIDETIGEEQEKDEEIAIVKATVKATMNDDNKEKTKERDESDVKGRGKQFRSLMEKRGRMVVEENVLKWVRREDVSNIDRKLVVIPEHLEEEVINRFHQMGHFGVEKLEKTILQHAYIYGLREKLRLVVGKCERCQARKGPHRHFKLELKNQVKGYFNEKVQMDLITMRKSRKGNTRGLSIVDVYSGYSWCCALKNGTAKEVADAFVKEWVSRHGVPAELQSDNGNEFQAMLMVELCKKLEMKKINNSPYAPFSTGKVERWNRTLKNMVATMTDDLAEWDENLELLSFYYNVTENATTGFSPFEIATGRKAMLPASCLWDSKPERQTHIDYVDATMRRMRDASRRVYRKTRENQKVIKREFDKRIHGEPLEVGDLVRVHSKAPAPHGITTKLLSRWRGPFEIVEKLTDKAYVVMMPVDNVMRPKVQNYRNLWRVKKRKERTNEEVETSDFFAEAEREAVNEENVSEGSDNDENLDDVEDNVDGDNDSDDDEDANEGSEAAVVEKRGGNEAAEKDVNDRLKMTDRNEARGLGDEKEKRKGAPGEVVTRAGRLVKKPKRLDL